MIKKIIDKIKERINGEHDCPAHWWQQGMEDCDEGCALDMSLVCGRCKYRFYPNFIIVAIVKRHDKKIKKYWDELVMDEILEDMKPKEEDFAVSETNKAIQF